MASSLRRLFHDSDFVVGEAVELVDELVNLLVSCVNPALEDGAVVIRDRRGKLLEVGEDSELGFFVLPGTVGLPLLLEPLD